MVENRRRTTKQRLAIRALFDDEPFFLTAQQVHDQLRNRGDQVGPVSYTHLRAHET